MSSKASAHPQRTSEPYALALSPLGVLPLSVPVPHLSRPGFAPHVRGRDRWSPSPCTCRRKAPAFGSSARSDFYSPDDQLIDVRVTTTQSPQSPSYTYE